MVRNALIAGASGLTGNELTLRLIRSDYYNSVHAIGRNPLQIEHPKLRSHIVDFGALQDFKPDVIIHHVYICLGTTRRKAGSKANFRRVDLEYVLNIGTWALNNSVEKLSVISSAGTSPAVRNFYLRTKADMEAGLVALNLPSLVIVRPSLLLGKRNELRPAERLATLIMRPIGKIMTGRLRRYRPVEASVVASALFKSLINAGEGVTIVENESIELYH